MKNGTAYLLGVLSAAGAGLAGRLTGVAPKGDLQAFVDTKLPEAPVLLPGVKHIACIGDSITFGDGVKPTRPIHSYPALLQGLLQGEAQVLNYGLNGRTLLNGGDRPYRKELFWKLACQCGAETYLVMLGTNDTKPYNWETGDYEAELFEMIEDLKFLPQRPEVILIAPGRCFAQKETGVVAFDIQNDLIEGEVVPAVYRVAKRADVRVINLYDVTKDHPEYFADGVHPNPEGNRVIAKTIFEGLS